MKKQFYIFLLTLITLSLSVKAQVVEVVNATPHQVLFVEGKALTIAPEKKNKKEFKKIVPNGEKWYLVIKDQNFLIIEDTNFFKVYKWDPDLYSYFWVQVYQTEIDDVYAWESVNDTIKIVEFDERRMPSLINKIK